MAKSESKKFSARVVLLAVGVLVLGAALSFFLWHGIYPPPAGPGSPELPTSVTPDRGCLSGSLVDASYGDGIAGVAVRLSCEGSPDRQASSGEGGAFSFDQLTPGECTLIASAAGHLANAREKEARERVTVRAGKALDGVQLRLFRESQISGRVSADGRPVQGARLSLVYLEAPGETTAFSVEPGIVSVADGSFLAEKLGPGRVQVLAEADGFGLTESTEVFLRSGTSASGVDISLSGAALVAGLVVDLKRQPIAGAEVRLVAEATRGPRTVQTDSEGRFRFSQVPPGSFQVTARAQGFGSGMPQQGKVEAGGQVEVTLTLKPVAGIVGRVEDAKGQSVAGAMVVTRSIGPAGRTGPMVHSDASGAFWIPGPFGTQELLLSAMHPGYGSSPEVSVDVGTDSTVVLTLTEPGGLAGRVVAAASGRPVPLYNVRVEGVETREGSARGVGMSRRVNDPDGRFEIVPLAPGTFKVDIEAPGFSSATIANVNVRSGQKEDLGVIPLRSGGSLTGRVVDAKTNQPVEGASVGLMESEAQYGWATTDHGGAFRLQGVPAERITVSVVKRGFLTEMISGVEPPEGGERDLGVIKLQASSPGEEATRKYAGVGAVLSVEDGHLRVRDLLEDSPGLKSGLQSGSEILRIDGFDTSELGLRRAVELIRGEPGSRVTLEVLLPGSSYPQTVQIERSNIVSR